jgi:macrodomain Ter protein organizer (MatP/YcbG family)
LAQPRYTISDRDRIAAERYLSHKLQRGDWLADDVTRELAAKIAYREVAGDADSLNAWCEKWLSRVQWMQLKHAIRAARRRKKAGRTRDPSKHVVL